MSISEPEVYSYATWLLSMDGTCFDDVDLVRSTNAAAARLFACCTGRACCAPRAHLTTLAVCCWCDAYCYACSPACCMA